MAKIEKMKIMGIRSYSPEEGSVIEFQTPLTLIVGQNGCGKTTVIESLSYNISGNLPPGCKSATSFINDPKIAGESQVKGQVKLQFRDITGNQLISTRSCQSIQKAKKMESKAIEGVIQKINDDGKAVSLSSRCTDLTKEMISRLGVSKAVLDNVIFCHQENSYWPLGEGKSLKEKFDAIFAATRYIKALESIRNLRKEQGGEVKTYASELGYLTETKNKAAEIKKDLSKAESQVLVTKDDIQKITRESKPIEDQLEELDKVSNDIMHINTNIVKMKSRKTELEKTIGELEQTIDQRFQGSFEELKLKQSDFASRLAKKETDLHDLKTRIGRIDIELNSLEERRTKLMQVQGRLEKETADHQALVKGRDDLINVLAKDFEISGYNSSSYEPHEADTFINKLKDVYIKSVEEGKKTKAHYKEELQEADKTIMKYQKSLNSYESIMDQKQKMIKTNQTKINDLSSQLNRLAASENRIHNIEKQLRQKETELDEYRTDNDTERLENEIKELSRDKKDKESVLVTLKDEENLMLQNSAAQTKISMMEDDKAQKKDQFDGILRNRQGLLEDLFDTRPPAEELKPKLKSFLQRCQADLRKQTDELQKYHNKVTKLESERNLAVKEQNKKEEKLNFSSQRVHDVCQENDYNEFRELVRQQVQSYHKNLSELSAYEKIYQKYLLDLSDDSQTGCPLCHRDFDSKRDIRNLINELETKIEDVPGTREALQQTLEQQKDLEQSILDIAPEKNQMDTLNEELPILEEKIRKLNLDIQKEKESLEKISTAKKATDQKEKNARTVEADVIKIDDLLYDLKDLDTSLNMERSKLKGVTDGRSMQSIRSEVQEKEVVIGSLSRKIDQKRDHLMEGQRKLSELEREVNQLNSTQLSLKTELQKQTQLQHQKAELTSTNQSYEREIREASGQLQPIRDQLELAKEDKRDKEMVLETFNNDVKDKLNKIKSKGDRIREMVGSIQRYLDEGRDTALEDNQEQMRTVETRKKTKTDEKRAKTADYNDINEEISKQSILKREMDDNVKIMEKEREINDIEKKITDYRKELNQYGNFQDFQKDRGTLQEKLDEFRKRKAGLQGRLQGFEDEVKRCQRDLASSMYADADLKHCQKVIEMKTTELASQDLDKYYKALDRAIMRYHSLKLADINKIIKEYWVKTYQGGDIDTIEITAETDEDGSGASKSRRSYNYRVIMVKGATSLDMRGRCSAGQKVIASIIIRLALAETFCLNCGILALDEPTTNLDEQNIASLAHSLREIIDHRRQQKNFQLVIITHDEDFVQALGRSDYVENYFKVYKNETQHSKIKKMNFREL
eukprot:TCONS_00064034-protein